MMPDYWAVPNHQHAPHRLHGSSFINNSINPHTWGEKGAVPIHSNSAPEKIEIQIA